MRKLLFVLLVLVSSFMFSTASAQDDETACTPTQPEGWIVYTINAGDSLAVIARRTGTTIEALQRANCIRDPQLIRAGTDIFIPAESDVDPLLRRCYNAGLSVEECREMAFGDENHFAERCLNAGFNAQQCRRIWNALNDDDTTSPFLRRCLNAGFTEQECRRIWNAQNNDDTDMNAFLRRCLNAGFTEQECRRIWNTQDDGDTVNPFLRRCLNAGFTEQECRRIWNAQDDGEGGHEVTEVPPVREVPPVITPTPNAGRRGHRG